jgi:hypothetical protein
VFIMTSGLQLKMAAALMLAAGGLANAQSITTTFVSNNGGSAGGATYFNATTNTTPLTVTGFDVNTSALAGTTFGFSVYTLVGTYVGNETNVGAWTLQATGIGTSAGQDLPSTVVLSQPFDLNAGTQYGMAVVLAAPGEISAAQRYTNGTGANQNFANTHISLALGSASNVPFSGTPFTPRVFNGTIRYTLGDPTALGACCLPTGACQQLNSANCIAQGGSYQGASTDCATANCPQPGACCFADGTCSFIPEPQCQSQGGSFFGVGQTCAAAQCPQPGACCLESGCTILSAAECTARLGIYNGDSSTCAAANCPERGACCLPNGGCVSVIESKCLEWAGVFHGANSSCGVGQCWSAPILFNSGSMVTHVGQGFGGADASQIPAGANTIGENVSLTAGVRLAQDFTVPAGEVWTVNKFTTYAYQTGAPVSGTITDLVLRIWDGDPRDPASQVVWGDITTNIRDPNASGFSNVYRVTTGTGLQDTARALQRIVGNVPDVQLSAGTYWVEWSTRGSTASGPFAPLVTVLNNIPLGDALIWRNAPWAPVVDTTWNGIRFPGGQPAGLPFILEGSIGTGPACYANCDGSTVAPVLNVDDFTCFINRYAAAQSLPTAQQITDYANCDGSTIVPVLNVDDFTCFINRYAQGCP